MNNSQTKFGWILSKGLGGESITGRRMEGEIEIGDNNIPFSFFKKNMEIIKGVYTSFASQKYTTSLI